MSIYAVFLNEPNEEAWKSVKEKWPGRHFILTGNLAFVAPEGITTTSDIAGIVGIGGESELLGIVFDWAAHNGFNRGDLWEWLGKVQP